MARFAVACVFLSLIAYAACTGASYNTSKNAYQFGETITTGWSGDIGDGTNYMGLFLPNVCSTNSTDCMDVFVASAAINSPTGSYDFLRDSYERFFGTLEFRVWNYNTQQVIYSKNLTVSGSANIVVPQTVYMFIEVDMQFTVSSAFHSGSDFFALLVDGCTDPDDTTNCAVSWGWVPPTTSGWWNVTFTPGTMVNTSGTYRIAYVLDGGGNASPALKTGTQRLLYLSNPFKIVNSGSLSLPKSTFAIHEPLNFTWNANAMHPDYDCITIWPRGADITTAPYLAYQWVPAGPSGIMSFPDGMKYPGDYTAYYLTNCDNVLTGIASTFNYTVTANVSLSVVSTMVRENVNFLVSVQTLGFQGGSDSLGIFTADCDTADKIINRQPGQLCADLNYNAAWVPQGVKSSKLSIYAPPATQFRVWYMSNGDTPLVQLPLMRSVTTVGQCAQGCANAAALCGAETDCLTCGSVATKCVAVQQPTLTGATPADGWYTDVFPGGPEGVIRFSIDAHDNGFGPLSIQFTGFSDAQLTSGEVAVVQSAITGGSRWNVTWTTQALAQNLYVDFCYTILNSVGVGSDPICYNLQTRGRNCRSFGDPHMTTFDEYSYDFMGYGDFYLVKSKTYASDKFSIQVRMVPCSTDPGAPACNKAIAFTDDKGKFAVYFNDTSSDSLALYQYAGQDFATLDLNANVTLPNGASLSYDGYTISIALRSGIYTEVAMATQLYNNIQIKMPSAAWLGNVLGLCGDWDNNNANDFVFPNGTTLASSAYYDWGVTWRINQTDSAFNYTGVFPTYQSVNQANPSGNPAQWSSTDFETTATTLCQTILGMANTDLTNCLFDIRATNNLKAAASAALQVLQACSQMSNTLQASNPQCSLNQACPNRCSFLGKCNSSNKCDCLTGFGGADCSAAISTLPPGSSSNAPGSSSNAPSVSVVPTGAAAPKKAAASQISAFGALSVAILFVATLFM